jgi:hypothetical protein
MHNSTLANVSYRQYFGCRYILLIETLKLVDIYTMWYPTQFPYSPIKPSFGIEESTYPILSDPGVCHLSISHVAIGGYGILPSKNVGADVMYHLGQTLSIINKRIANFQDEPVAKQDKTLQVVSILTHFEVRIYLSLISLLQ